MWLTSLAAQAVSSRRSSEERCVSSERHPSPLAAAACPQCFPLSLHQLIKRRACCSFQHLQICMPVHVEHFERLQQRYGLEDDHALLVRLPPPTSLAPAANDGTAHGVPFFCLPSGNRGASGRRGQ